MTYSTHFDSVGCLIFDDSCIFRSFRSFRFSFPWPSPFSRCPRRHLPRAPAARRVNLRSDFLNAQPPTPLVMQGRDGVCFWHFLATWESKTPKKECWPWANSPAEKQMFVLDFTDYLVSSPTIKIHQNHENCFNHFHWKPSLAQRVGLSMGPRTARTASQSSQIGSKS